MSRQNFALFLSVLVFALGFKSVAYAEQPVIKKFYDSVYCSSFVQLCNAQQLTSIRIKKGVKSVKFLFSVVGNNGCSSIRVTPYLNGKALPTSEFLGWSGSNTGRNLITRSYNLGRLRKGKYLFQLAAEGIVGGCNIGYLGSWGGTYIFAAASTTRKATVAPLTAAVQQTSKEVSF